MLKALGDYAEAMTKVHADDVVVLDEFGLNLGMTRQRGWGPQGERVRDAVPFTGHSRHTLLATLSREGPLTEIVFEGYLDTKIFVRFVRDYLAPELLPGQVVLMDNLKIHKSPEAERLIKKAGAEVLFLPPYMPELSPVELCGSKYKQLIRAHRPADLDEMARAARTAIASVTQQDAIGWFRHCGLEEP